MFGGHLSNHWSDGCRSLKFKVTGSKTVVDILLIQKSSHFESKCKQMK